MRELEQNLRNAKDFQELADAYHDLIEAVNREFETKYIQISREMRGERKHPVFVSEDH